MGTIYADLKVRNAAKSQLQELEVRSVCDSGAVITCVPQEVAEQLDLNILGEKTATTADGKPHRVPYAGPVQISFLNRTCVSGVLIFGNEVLLGATDMQDLDVTLDIRNEKLILPPDCPNFAVYPVRRRTMSG